MSCIILTRTALEDPVARMENSHIFVLREATEANCTAERL